MELNASKKVVCSKRHFAYIVLIFAATNVIFLGGKRRAFGIFVADLHHGEFRNTSLAELNWIGDSYAALGYMSTTVSTAMILKLNRHYRMSQLAGALLILLACVTSAMVSSAHWLFLTHTVLHGLGSSLILSTVGLIVNEYFDKSHPHHILATTLISGGSVASIVFVELYAYLIVAYGWRKTFLLLGVIYFLINSSASLVFIRKPMKTPQIQTAKKCTLQSCGNIKKSQVPLLVLWMIDRMMTSIVTYGMLLNLADYLRRSSTSLTKSTSLTVLFAAGEASTYLIGAIAAGLTKNLFQNRLKYVLLITTLILAFSLLTWEFFANNPHLSRFFAYLSGFCLGPSITFLFPAGEELTTLPGHMAYPFSLFGMGLGMAVSPLLSAQLAQLFDYRWFFLVQGVLIGIKFACLATSCLILSFRTRPIEIFDDSDKKHLLDSESDTDAEAHSKQHSTTAIHNKDYDVIEIIRNR